MARVVRVLEAALADDAGVVADLARLTLPYHVAEAERCRAHALRRCGGQSFEGRLMAANDVVLLLAQEQRVEEGGQLLVGDLPGWRKRAARLAA